MSHSNNLSDIGLRVCYWDGCLAQFSSFDALFVHLKEFHVNNQSPSLPRVCRWLNTCSYQTSEKKHLISHLRSHLDWRPYSCEQCSSKFKHEHEIRRHVDKIHKPTYDANSTAWNNHTPNNNNLYHQYTPALNKDYGFPSTPEPNNTANDSVLSEIVEFALGLRENLRMDSNFKNQVIMMGLSLSILDTPREQLKRHLLDGFYHYLVLSSMNTPGLHNSRENTPSMGYPNSSYIHQNQTTPMFNQSNPVTVLSQQQSMINPCNYISSEASNQQTNFVNHNNYSYPLSCIPSQQYHSNDTIPSLTPTNPQSHDPMLFEFSKPDIPANPLEGSSDAAYRSITIKKEYDMGNSIPNHSMMTSGQTRTPPHSRFATKPNQFPYPMQSKRFSPQFGLGRPLGPNHRAGPSLCHPLGPGVMSIPAPVPSATLPLTPLPMSVSVSDESGSIV